MDSERSEKNSITTSKATQRGTVAFPVDLYFTSAADALRSIFLFCLSLAGGRATLFKRGPC